MTPTAYVDESEPGDRRDPGAYMQESARRGLFDDRMVVHEVRR